MRSAKRFAVNMVEVIGVWFCDEVIGVWFHKPQNNVHVNHGGLLTSCESTRPLPLKLPIAGLRLFIHPDLGWMHLECIHTVPLLNILVVGNSETKP